MRGRRRSLRMKLSSSSTLTCIEVMHINQEKRREENELSFTITTIV
jgi:hypothetical protein